MLAKLLITATSMSLALLAAPGAQAARLSFSVEQSVEGAALREAGPWLPEVLAAARQSDPGMPLAGQTTLGLQWNATFQWPGSAMGAADVSWALRLPAFRVEHPPQRTAEADFERLRLSWLVPGGTLQLGRFLPTWGKGFAHQVSSPMEGMGKAPYAGLFTWAGVPMVTAGGAGLTGGDPDMAATDPDTAPGVPVVTEVGWARSATRPFEGTGGPDPVADVLLVRFSATGTVADGALAGGYRTGRGPWISAQLARQLDGGWQVYGEGILARPYRPARMTRPEESSQWSGFAPPAYGAAYTVRWLAGVWHTSPEGWNLVAEYRYEPGGLDEQEAAAFWQAAAGKALPAEPQAPSQPPGQATAAELAAASSGAALQKLAGLARDGLSLRRRYLDWAVRQEHFNAAWTWGVSGTFNLDDGSSAWVPEARYRASDETTLSLRLVLFQGSTFTEYGGSPRAWSAEVRLTRFLQ